MGLVQYTYIFLINFEPRICVIAKTVSSIIYSFLRQWNFTKLHTYIVTIIHLQNSHKSLVYICFFISTVLIVLAIMTHSLMVYKT